MADTSTIRLFNHLGNGGSFTLNSNKTISVSVAWSSGTIQVDCYPTWNGDFSAQNKYTIGPYTIYAGDIGTNSLENAVLHISPQPTSITSSGTTWKYKGTYNGYYRYNAITDSRYVTLTIK